MKGAVLDKPNILERLQVSMDLLLSTSEKDNILQAYDLRKELQPNEPQAGLIALATDLRFHLPVLLVLHGWKNKINDVGKPRAYRYHFHQVRMPRPTINITWKYVNNLQPNPFDGHFKGLASHELDIAYLLRNFDEHMNASDRIAAAQMSEIWINFAYGLGWPEGNGNESVLVIGDQDQIKLVDDHDYDLRFRRGRGQMLLNIGWEKSFKLGEMLQGCYSKEEEEIET